MTHHRMAADAGVAATLLLLGVTYGAEALREGIGSMADTGPGFFPVLVAAILTVSSTAVLVREVRGAPTPPKLLADEDDESFQGDVDWWRIGGVLTVALVVPLAAGTLGFVITLSAALIAISKIMGLPGWRAPVLLGVSFGAATWLIFVHWLFVPLPAGSLGLA